MRALEHGGVNYELHVLVYHYAQHFDRFLTYYSSIDGSK
jgi:hypothetical protein